MDPSPDVPAPSAPPPPEACVSCGRTLKAGAAFCGACGHHRGDPPVDRRQAIHERFERVRRRQSGWEGVRGLILMYLVLLGSQAATGAVAKASDEFTADVVGTSLQAFIVLVAALLHRESLRDCCSRGGFGPAGYLFVLLAAIPIMLGVCGYAYGVGRLFRIHEDDPLATYQGHGLAWAFFLTAVLPPIFEELGFRGVIFSQLGRSLDARETILISAVAFGILHLSIPTLITHIPLGLYFGWLRHRSGSLYPSIFAHALHNGLVVIAEAAHWMPGST